jgi:diaminohydroxyphosphoribosylaminopyrimidine deaminase/5-amino-6-(5-phosphoribosylamino)uracil reductase
MPALSEPTGAGGPPGHVGGRPPEAPLVALAEQDLAWLERAIRLGRRGWGRVHTNPMVGCVLVREGRVLSEGWHREFGGPHAEVDALEHAGEDPTGATAYVSLEPCRHHGKTPACTDALLRAGVARVVYAVAAPDPGAAGGGAVLRASGLRVEGPVWPESVGRRENPTFFHVHGARAGRPFVALKLALSLDGMIAAAPGERTQISGPESSAAAHKLRAGFEAVLVGANTARADDPRLTVRKGGVEPLVPPARMVLDAEASLSPDSALFREQAGRAAVFVAEDVDEARLERLERAGAVVHPVPRAKRGLDLGAVLDLACGLGIRSILCEGGGRLASSFLAERLVQRIYIVHAPIALGPRAVPAFPGPFPEGTWEGWGLAFPPEQLGRDVLAVYEREP